MRSSTLVAALSAFGGALGEYINCYNGNVYDSSLHALPQNRYACWLLANGQTVGGYPKRWYNHEELTPPWVSGPYWEFPIKTTTYTGGSPGPDRMIFNGSPACDFAGFVTHTGMSDNGFRSCNVYNR